MMLGIDGCCVSDLLVFLTYIIVACMWIDGKLRGRCGTPGYVAPEILKSGRLRPS